MNRDNEDDDDDDDDDFLTGLARPQLLTAAAPIGDDDDDVDEDEDEGAPRAAPAAAATGANGNADDDDDGDEDFDEAGGLMGAEAAFALETAPGALELDPFRVAAGLDVPAADPSAAGKATARKAGAAIPRKMFVGNLPHSMDDAGLVRFFARYGKVQEASAVKGDKGQSRGFGFVTFVSDKGARFCLKEAGDPPVVKIDGRECSVRYAEQKDNHGARQHKMPARGNIDHLGLNAKRVAEREAKASAREASAASRSRDGGDGLDAPSVSMIAAAHKRGAPQSAAPRGGGEPKRSKVPQEEKGIVTVSRRQDAEPLNKQPITMREIFPKEFWRI